MTIDSTHREQRKARAHIAVVVIAVLVIAVLAGLVLTGGSDDQPTVDPPATIFATPVEHDDVTWRDVAGASLPFSQLHGPRITTNGQAAGYSTSEAGAALAAVQILIRTSASAGPTVYAPVLATQVTGTNLPAMKLALNDQYEQLRATAGIEEGAPISGTNAQITGYVLNTYDATNGTATVDVVLTSNDLQATDRYIGFTVQLRWADEDWRVLAPPSGDWGSIATTLPEPPAGTLDYGQIGRS